jgi:hypothetical protein
MELENVAGDGRCSGGEPRDWPASADRVLLRLKPEA